MTTKHVSEALTPDAWLAEGYGWKRVVLDKEAAQKLCKYAGQIAPLYFSPAPLSNPEAPATMAVPEVTDAMVEAARWIIAKGITLSSVAGKIGVNIPDSVVRNALTAALAAKPSLADGEK